METRSGKMPPIELGQTRPLGAVDVRTFRSAGGAKPQVQNARSAQTGVVKSEALDPGLPPVDAERVDLVRKAVESGTYPLVPAKVADAIIAAGLLLRSAR
jgi:negative regulator of flagellin synthesis FlgM